MNGKFSGYIFALVGLFLTLPFQLEAQIRASERGSVSQTVDGTVISLDYGRPKTRGRENLFPGVVPWGKVWTPGANWATTIDVSGDVTINGHELAEGRYSVWFEVQPDQWTAIFDPEPRRFHLMPPPTSDDQLRFPINPVEASHTDLLTWSFTDFRPTGTTLEFAWGTTSVTFDIGVQPSREIPVSADFARRFTGSYVLNMMEPLPPGEVPFAVTYEDGRLVAHWEAMPNPRLRQPWLVYLGEGMFAPAEVEDGELFDIVMDVIFEFYPLEGTATRFELRVLDDQLWGEGRRTD